MNQIKIGKFIAELRKGKKMTQEEMGEKLGVSGKSVSRWENGKNMPDIALFTPLCALLDITVNELINGEKMEEEQIAEKAEENLVAAIEYSNKKIGRANRKMIAVVILSIAVLVSAVLVFDHIYFSPCAYYEGDTSQWAADFPNHSAYQLALNAEGKPVFKHPSKALRQAKVDYSDTIKEIRKEQHLLPLSKYNYKQYAVYGWQINSTDTMVTDQGADLTGFLDIYENSFD